MNQKFVLDCSVAVSWCFEDESSAYTENVLASLENNTAIVPELWHLEVCNVLLMAQRCGRIMDSRIFHFMSLLKELPIVADKAKRSMQELVSIGQKHNLTSYDSCYLHLCLSRALPLATTDKKLMDALVSFGGRVYEAE